MSSQRIDSVSEGVQRRIQLAVSMRANFLLHLAAAKLDEVLAREKPRL